MAAPAALLVMGVSGSGKNDSLCSIPPEAAKNRTDLKYHNLPRPTVLWIRNCPYGQVYVTDSLLPQIDRGRPAGIRGWKFYDADDYHPEENRIKMGKGIPLNDQDRIPWLCNLHEILLRDVASGQHVVLACSALKKVYRDILIRGRDDSLVKHDEPGKEGKLAEVKLLVVHLSGSFEVISERLFQRKGHFMPPELLQSQFDTLEPPSAPEKFIQISVDKTLPEIVAIIVKALK